MVPNLLTMQAGGGRRRRGTAGAGQCAGSGEAREAALAVYAVYRGLLNYLDTWEDTGGRDTWCAYRCGDK